MIDGGEFCAIGGGALLTFVIDQIFGYRATTPTFYVLVWIARGRNSTMNEFLDLRVQVISFEGQTWKEY